MPLNGDPGVRDDAAEDLTPIPPAPLTFLERHGISPALFAVLSLIFVFLLYQFVAGSATLLLFGMSPSSGHVTGLRIMTVISQALFILLPTILLVRLISFTPSIFFRLNPPTGRQVVLAIVGMFSLQQVLQVLMILQEKIPLPESINRILDPIKQMIEEMYKMLVDTQSVPELLFVLFVIAVVPAIAEEFFFRGLVQPSFEKGLGSTKGLIVSGVIFGVYHLNPFALIPLCLLGIYLGFLTLRSGSIWLAVAAHFFNNAVAVVAVHFKMNDDALITGDSSQLSLAMILGTFAFFVIVFAITMRFFVQSTSKELDA